VRLYGFLGLVLVSIWVIYVRPSVSSCVSRIRKQALGSIASHTAHNFCHPASDVRLPSSSGRNVCRYRECNTGALRLGRQLLERG
jgi:hypothetical protein